MYKEQSHLDWENRERCTLFLFLSAPSAAVLCMPLAPSLDPSTTLQANAPRASRERSAATCRGFTAEASARNENRNNWNKLKRHVIFLETFVLPNSHH